MSQWALRDKLLDCYPRWSPTMYKLTLGGAVLFALVLPLALVALPFVEFFNGMAAQPKGRPQMTFGRVFGAELLVERSPVDGTVPRGHYDYAYDHMGNTIEDARKVGEQLYSPLPITMDNLRRGRELYNVYCAVCHGSRGQGDGPVIGPGRFPAPPSLHTEQAREYENGTLYHIMTKGLGKMPPYAGQLDPDERWRVAQFVHALERSMAPTPEDLTP